MTYENWMLDNNAAIESKKLRELCLPATHDSGTYHLGHTLAPDIAYYNWIVKLLEFKDNILGILLRRA